MNQEFVQREIRRIREEMRREKQAREREQRQLQLAMQQELLAELKEHLLREMSGQAMEQLGIEFFVAEKARAEIQVGDERILIYRSGSDWIIIARGVHPYTRAGKLYQAVLEAIDSLMTYQACAAEQREQREAARRRVEG